MLEENTVFGNTNGINLAPDAERNVIRRNWVVGNPPIQVAVDHTADIGNSFDIKNRAPLSLGNVFTANVCLTALNAPCPALEASLTASPNPIPVAGSAIHGMTKINWIASGDAEVRVGSPDGPLLASGARGSVETGLWVADGMTFYLQDVSGGKALTAENTLATLVVRFARR